MMTFRLKERPTVPLEAEVLCPDRIAGLTADAVAALPVFHGKRQHRLDTFFEIDGPPGENLELNGDLSRVKWIGRGMTCGRVRIVGSAGMHLGAYMTGGTIEVTGSAADWVGGEMRGGTIHVGGDAGGQVGAAYRGSMAGMAGGTILVEGAAGIEVGMRMKRGLIAVKGPVRDFAGLQMKGGSLFLLGGAEVRTGAWMTRGTIVTLAPVRLMPTFSFACSYSPSFLRVYAHRLRAAGFEIPCGPNDGSYRRYTGDSSVPGRGEILTWQPAEAYSGARQP